MVERLWKREHQVDGRQYVAQRELILDWSESRLGHLAFNVGVPEQPPAVSGYDVALVRDRRIAVLYTLLSAGG